MATAGGSYQIYIRVSAHRAARRLKGLQSQLSDIERQVKGMPIGVMDGGENITTAGTKRITARSKALNTYAAATTKAAGGVSALNKASTGLGAKMESINAATPGKVKTDQMKAYASAMRSWGTAGAKGAEGATAFKAATKGMDRRLERIGKALPEAAAGIELLDHAMRGSDKGWTVMNAGVSKASPAMSAYAKATNAAAAAQERMNRASLGATKSQMTKDKPSAAVTRTGNVVKRSTAVQNTAATASVGLATSVGQNYEELASSARKLAASTTSLTAFGNNARSATSGIDLMTAANKRLATSITALAAAQKKLNTAYAGAVTQPKQAVAATTERVGNTRRAAAATAARAAVPNVDVQAMYGNLEGMSRSAAAAEPQVDRLATSMQRYAQAAKLASNSTRTLGRHLGTVAATAPGAAGAMNVATDSAAKTSLAAAAAAAGTVGTAASGAGAEIDKADRAMGRWSNTARTHGATMNWAGRQISMFFTLPLALAGGAAIKWQMDNEKAMTQVAKVYDGASSDIKNSLESIEQGGPHFQGSPLDRFFTALSSRMGKNKAEIADIAADWAAVGLKGSQLAGATQLTTEMMVLGDMEAEEATRSLIAVQAQYGLSLGNLKQEQEALNAVKEGTATALQKQIVETESLVDVMGTLNAVENATGATMPDLVRGFERTASVARQLGIDAQTLAAHMATLVPAMGTAERAGNALKTIYQALASPRTERQVAAMENLALNAGLAGDAFLNSQFLAEGMGKGIEEVAKAYSQLQGADRFTWARDVFGVYQYARGVQLLEDVSRGLGYQTDEQAEHMRNLSKEFAALGNGMEEAAFIADHFGLAADDMSDDARAAREEFTKLLREGEKAQSLSYYEKAGGEVGNLSSEEQLKLYQDELNAVLESNPHQFAMAMQVIKNAMADFIVPILPLIIAMTQEVAKLAQWLGNLPPATQKLIAMVVLTIAAFGPLIALLGTFFIATAMMSMGFKKLSGLMGLFRKDANGALSIVNKLSKAVSFLGRGKGGGGLFGGKGGGKGPTLPVIGGGGAASAWPRGVDDDIKRTTKRVDALGDESKDLSRKAGDATRSLDLFTGAILRQIAASQRAAGAAAVAGGAAGAAGGDGKDKNKRDKTGSAAFAGAMAGNIGIPGLGKLGRSKKVVDDAKKTQQAAAAVEKTGMMSRLANMLKFNKDAAGASSKGGGGIVRALMRPLMGLGKLILKPFGLITKAVMGLVGMLGGPIVAAIAAALAAIIGLMHAGGMSIGDFFKSIFGNVGDIVREAMGDGDIPLLARPFVAAGEVIADVVGRLPEIVGNAFIAIYNGIKVVAQKIWEVITTALNPFKRHSPSLVDNVLRGTSIISSQYAETGRRIAKVMTAARADVKAFSAATGGLSMNVENIRVAENREKIQAHAPQAVPLFDSLVGQQRELTAAITALNPHIKAQEQAVAAAQRAVDGYDKTIEQMSRSVELAERSLDGLNRRLDEAQKNFDRYSNAQIAGLGAVDDAIFANEMAQKRLQLALKKAGADDMATTEDALARIQGQMDDMAAKREGLRLGGAGSEILDVYDRQLNALAGQRTSAMTGPATEIERLNKALEDLQARAEVMDLEKSLKFDPLNRQLDKMRNKTEEMSFERITSGMALHGAQVELYQGQVDRASAAIERQRDAITAVEDQRYLANQALDAEREKLDLLTGAQNEMQEVLDEVSSALDTAIADAEAYASHLEKVADEAKKASDALGELGDAGGFGDAADFGVPGGSFDPNEILPSVDEMTNSLTDAIKGALEGISWGSLMPNINWGGIWDGILLGLKNAIPSVSYITGYLIGLAVRLLAGLGAALGWVMSKPGELAMKIFEWVVQAFKDIDWEKLKDEGFMQSLSDVGINIIKGILEGGKNFFLNVKDWAGEYIVTPFIDGLKKGLGINSPATTMLPIGWDIVAGIFQGIMEKLSTAGEWFGNLPSMIGTALGNWWETGKAKASDLWGGIQEMWGTVVENVRTFGSDIWTKLKEGLGDLWETATTWVQGLRDGIETKWGEIVEFARGLGAEVYAKIKEGLGDLWQLGVDTAEGLMRGIESKASELWNRAKSWAENAVKGTQEGVDSHSPSRATMAVGRDVAEGFIIGMESRSTDVASAAARMAAAAIPDAAPTVKAATKAAPTVPAATGAPSTGEGEGSPFEAIATDAQTNLGQVTAIAQAAADTTAAGYLTTMGGMRMADLASQVNHAATYAANAANLTTAAVTQAASMATGTVSQANIMATGVTSAGASMATGVLSAGASMEAGMNASMARMSSNVSGIINGEIAPVINSIDPMLATMTGWFDSSVNNVGTIWSGIGPRTAEPARYVVDRVYNQGLRGAWNSFNEFLGLDPLPLAVANFATGGPVDFRNGGTVRGPGTGTSDSIPARLSNGEHVITAREVKNAGGHDVIKAQRQVWASSRSAGRATYTSPADRHYALAAGGPVLAFAKGGPVEGGEMPPMKGSEANLNMNAVRAGRAVSLKFPQVSTIGGYRPSDPFPDHPSGNALDIMVGSLALGDAIHSWLWANNSKLFMASDIWKQTYWTSPTNGSLMEDRGSITQNHFDHVHALFTPSPPHRPGMKYGGVPIGAPAVFAGAGSGGMSVDWGQVVGMTFDTEMDAIRRDAPNFPGIVGQWVPKSIEKAEMAKKFLATKLQEMTHYQGTIDDSMGAVERWRPMMKAALIRQGLGHWAEDPAILNRFMKQIQTESGGNPSILQQVQDVNSGGNEALGLAQIIPGTFATWRDPSLPNDRTDPWASLNAMARYVRGKYGPQGYLSIGNGIGYDQGGILQPTPGGFGTYYNHTGKPEAVLTNAQWRAIYRAASMTPGSLAGVAAAAAKAAVEQVTADDAPWKAAILGEVQAIATSAAEPPVDPWEGFNSLLNSVNDVAQKAGSIGQAIIAAQDQTAEALAAADERILTAAQAAADAAAAEADKVAAETEKVAAEVSSVGDDTTQIVEAVANVAENVEEIADQTPAPELFTEALNRLWGEANSLYAAAIAEATGTLHNSINSGDLQGGIASLEGQVARQGEEANRIARETMTLLGQNLDTVAAVVGAWKPVVDGIYELTKAIPSAELRNSPWMNYPGGPSTFMEKTDWALDGIWNVGAASFNLMKDVLPSLIKNTVGIGSGILNFMAENGDAVAAIGVAIATGNIAAVLPFIPKILGAALELLPMIIQAIQEIVPALIKGIMDFIGSIFNFGNRAFAYDSMEDATRAVKENTAAIRKGTYVYGQEDSGTLDRGQGGSMVVFNGDLSFPGITNENDAKGFLVGVQSLSGR